MGFMDKAKEAANQALAQAQQATQQGQAKVQHYQQTQALGDLYRTLGEAFYNEQRAGGGTEAVVAALAAVDNQFVLIRQAQEAQAAAQAQIPQGPPAQSPGYAPPATFTPPPPVGYTPPPSSPNYPPPPPSGGNFTLDDL